MAVNKFVALTRKFYMKEIEHGKMIVVSKFGS